MVTFISRIIAASLADHKVSEMDGEMVRSRRDLPVNRGKAIKSFILDGGTCVLVENPDGRFFWAREENLVLDL